MSVKPTLPPKQISQGDRFLWSSINLPSLITIAALFTGFWALTSVWQGKFDLACTAVVIAGILDYLDGRVARLSNAETKFGGQVDSIADVVSFGIAPASIFLYWGQESELPNIIFLIVALFYLGCTSLRLAHFNVMMEDEDTQPSSTEATEIQEGQDDQEPAIKNSYSGLPSPVAAMMTIGWVWNAGTGFMSPSGTLVYILGCLAVVLSGYLMLSPIKFSRISMLRSKEGRQRRPVFSIVFIAIVFAMLVAEMQIAVLFLAVSYISIGLFANILFWYRGSDNPQVVKNEKN